MTGVNPLRGFIRFENSSLCVDDFSEIFLPMEGKNWGARSNASLKPGVKPGIGQECLRKSYQADDLK